MERPVLKHEAGQEHDDPQSPEDGDGRYLAIMTVADPEPAQQEHRKTVDGP